MTEAKILNSIQQLRIEDVNFHFGRSLKPPASKEGFIMFAKFVTEGFPDVTAAFKNILFATEGVLSAM